MHWYNWVGASIFFFNFLGLHQLVWKKVHHIELTPFESAMFQGMALILFVINR